MFQPVEPTNYFEILFYLLLIIIIIQNFYMYYQKKNNPHIPPNVLLQTCGLANLFKHFILRGRIDTNNLIPITLDIDFVDRKIIKSLESINFYDLLPYINDILTILFKDVDMELYAKIVTEAQKKCTNEGLLTINSCMKTEAMKHEKDLNKMLRTVLRNARINADKFVFPSYSEAKVFVKNKLPLSEEQYYQFIENKRNALRNLRESDAEIKNLTFSIMTSFV